MTELKKAFPQIFDSLWEFTCYCTDLVCYGRRVDPVGRQSYLLHLLAAKKRYQSAAKMMQSNSRTRQEVWSVGSLSPFEYILAFWQELSDGLCHLQCCLI